MYMDTDSVVLIPLNPPYKEGFDITKDIYYKTQIHDQPGGLELEHTFSEFHVVRPKMYHGVDNNEKINKAKGVSRAFHSKVLEQFKNPRIPSEWVIVTDDFITNRIMYWDEEANECKVRFTKGNTYICKMYGMDYYQKRKSTAGGQVYWKPPEDIVKCKEKIAKHKKDHNSNKHKKRIEIRAEIQNHICKASAYANTKWKSDDQKKKAYDAHMKERRDLKKKAWDAKISWLFPSEDQSRQAIDEHEESPIPKAVKGLWVKQPKIEDWDNKEWKQRDDIYEL